MRALGKAALAVAVLLAIVGCQGVAATRQEANAFRRCLNAEEIRLSSSVSGLLENLDKFLDCAVGPADDDEARLLRAHILVGVLSHYAAFNLTGQVAQHVNLKFTSFAGAPDNAGAMLVKIGQLERGYRSQSQVFAFGPADTDPTPAFLPNVRRANAAFERLALILIFIEAVRDAEAATVSRVEGFAVELSAAVAAPTPPNILSLAERAARGAEKLAVLETYREAYGFDIRAYLSCVQAGRPGPNACNARPQDNWKDWDRVLLIGCDRLALVARLDSGVCFPGQYR